MLILSRKPGEEVVIGDDIRVKVERLGGNRVTLSVDAPQGVKVWRREVWDKINAEASEGEGDGLLPS